ncbi:hypothetical protein Tco_1464405 [Tanacetum coccineum]
MKGGGVSFLNFLIIRYGSCQVEDSIWSKRYSEWYNDKKPRPRDYTFKEWVKLKKWHLDISKSVRKNLFKLWVIDKSTNALDLDEDPFGRCLDEYNWVFPKEIEQLADEYEIKIGEKGKFLMKYGQNVKELKVRIKIGGMITGRKNGSRFRKMTMEERKETLRDDGEDSIDET